MHRTYSKNANRIQHGVGSGRFLPLKISQIRAAQAAFSLDHLKAMTDPLEDMDMTVCVGATEDGAFCEGMFQKEPTGSMPQTGLTDLFGMRPKSVVVTLQSDCSLTPLGDTIFRRCDGGSGFGRFDG
mgnify:CR=1 FL=1